MKIFKNILIFLFVTTFYAYGLLPSECKEILTPDNKTNISIKNTEGAVDIVDLSGSTDDVFCPAIKYYKIKTLPTTSQGILYMADGRTAVTQNQQLTEAEAAGLKFDPAAGYVGNAIFTYSLIDTAETESTRVATVTIPVEDDTTTTPSAEPTADNKTNVSIVNTSGAVDIVDLSGKNSDGTNVSEFQITSLPTAEQGVLYMADGTTKVAVGQTLTLEEAKGLKFDPKDGFVGDATFTYVSIGVRGLSSEEATVTIPVKAPVENTTKPTADNKTNVSIVNTSGAVDIVDLSGKNSDGTNISEFQITSLPTSEQGVLYMADGTTKVAVGQTLTQEEANGLKFDPRDGFVGNATFTYITIDENGVSSDNATITIPVVNASGDNVKPTADDKVHTGTMSNQWGPTNILNLSGHDSEGNPVSEFQITSLPTAEQGVLYMADGRTAVTLGQILTQDEADGLKFDPKDGFVGDVTFTYVAIDGNGVTSDRATVTIPVGNIAGGENETKPTADDKVHTETMSNQWGPTNILNLSGKDSEGNAVTEFQITSLPTAEQGVLYMADGRTPVRVGQTLTQDEADGLKFDPKDGFVGDATFTYVAIDGNGVKSDPATVTIPVGNIGGADNQGTIITDDRKNPAILNTLGAVDITDLSGTDTNGEAITKFIITSLPTADQGILYMADGQTPVTLNQELTLEEANGLKFDPTAGYVGDATFNYVAIGSNGERGNSATVTLPIKAAINEADKNPTADDKNSPALTNNMGATNIANLSGTDKDGKAITKFVITSLPTADQGVLYMADGITPVTLNQELTLEEANGLKFDPKDGFVGDATFRYATIDNNGVIGDEATVTIPVRAADCEANGEEECVCEDYTTSGIASLNIAGMGAMALIISLFMMLFARKEEI